MHTHNNTATEKQTNNMIYDQNFFVPLCDLYLDWTMFAQSIYFQFFQRPFEKSYLESNLHHSCLFTLQCISCAPSRLLLMTWCRCARDAGLNKLFPMHMKSREYFLKCNHETWLCEPTAWVEKKSATVSTSYY